MAILPPDIIMDVLSLLPVKSLLRFKCVSKQFCSLIDSPELIKLHLNRSMENNSNLSLILRGWNTTKVLSTPLDLLGNYLLDNVRQLDSPFQNSSSLTPIVGSCNGLLAIQQCSGPIALWNPSTNKHRILPRFWSSDIEYHTRDVMHGFGYDITSDDYKVVRIECSKSVGDDKYYDVRVYSLKTNSWRQIKHFPFLFYFVQSTGALLRAALHWLVEQKDDKFILTFDLKSEECRRVQLPHVEDNKRFDEVHVFRGCLSVFCIQYGYWGPSSNMWIMDEYGVEESWTKLFTYPNPKLANFLPCKKAKALAYSKNQDKVLVHSRDLSWYDIEKLSGRIIFCQKPWYMVDSVLCTDSLVSLHAYTVGGRTS